MLTTSHLHEQQQRHDRLPCEFWPYECDEITLSRPHTTVPFEFVSSKKGKSYEGERSSTLLSTPLFFHSLPADSAD